MADLRQAIEVLRRQLRLFHVKLKIDYHSMILGLSPSFLEFYRQLVCEYDNDVSLFLLSKKFLLSETEDRRFMETLYRICRDLLNLKPPLSLAQFFTNSFAEKKLRMTAELVKAIGELRKELHRKKASENHSLCNLECATLACPEAFRRQSPSTSSRRFSNRGGGDGNRGVLRSTSETSPRSSHLDYRAQLKGFTSSRSLHLSSALPLKDAISSICTTGMKSPPADDSLRKHSVVASSSNRMAGQSYSAGDATVSFEPDYLPVLLATLNTLSTRLSHIVDRVSGIESRVCAIEKPMRGSVINPSKTILTDKDKSDPKEKEHPSSSEQPHYFSLDEETKKKSSLGTLNPPQGNKLFYHSNQHSRNQLSFSETSPSSEIVERSPRSSIHPAVSSNRCGLEGIPDDDSASGRYSLGPIDASKLSVNNADTSRPTEAQSIPIATYHPIEPILTFESNTLLCRSGAPPDSSALHCEQSTFAFTNDSTRAPPATNCTNTLNTRFSINQGLEKQVSRISNMLIETQDLLNNRQPLPTN